MSQTTHATSTSTSITSLQNTAPEKEGTAGPIVIGVSVASVLIILSLIFLAFFLIRRRKQRSLTRHLIMSDPEVSMLPVSKMDYLPREPSPPPPPYKDGQVEKDIESSTPPPIPPPKVSGRPFVSTRYSGDTEGDHRDYDNMVVDARRISFPEPAHHGRMF